MSKERKKCIVKLFLMECRAFVPWPSATGNGKVQQRYASLPNNDNYKLVRKKKKKKGRMAWLLVAKSTTVRPIQCIIY